MKVFLKTLQLVTLSVMGVVTILAVGLMIGERPVHAFPEFSEYTGEPCGTCHVSSGGGGPRTLRGLLWAAQGRPDEVPQLGNVLIAPGVEEGVELYDTACAGCHGKSGEGLYGAALVHSNMPENKIRSAILRGWIRRGMPSYEGQFTDEQLDTLVAYVAGIASGQVEPAPLSYPLAPAQTGCISGPNAEKCGGN